MPTEPVVTAIVSIYNCEHFIRGCMDDLLAQTLGNAVEILCVDTGSNKMNRQLFADTNNTIQISNISGLTNAKPSMQPGPVAARQRLAAI